MYASRAQVRTAVAALACLAACCLAGPAVAGPESAPPRLSQGDLVITEIMQNPSAVLDSEGEWFEVYNASGSSINMNGLIIKDDGTNTFTVGSDVIIAAGAYALFAENADHLTNGGLPTVDYDYPSTFVLANGDDEIVIMDGTTEIDRVNYDGGPSFPDPNGASMMLVDVSYDNNVGANWAEESNETYGDGDYGTPGAAPEPPLSPGDLVITEIMQNPSAVLDDHGEWFEIYNASGASIDLDGLIIKDDGSDSHTISGTVVVPSGGYALLVRNGDGGTNGGLPTVDYVYSGFDLANGDDEVVIMDGSTEIDRVAYDGGSNFPDPTGASMYLTSVALDNNVGSNWAEEALYTYGDGDYGTPGAARVTDTTDPIVTNVTLTNSTLTHTNDFVKDGDSLTLSADASDDVTTLQASDITADLSTLLAGGSSSVVAESYDGTTATWTTALAGVTLAADGAATVTVTATDGAANTGSGSDGITIDNTAPGNATDFAAEPAHEKVELSWSDASGQDAHYRGVMVRYNAWGDYPAYDTAAPAYPSSSTDGTELFSGDATGTTHAIVARDIYYYRAFVYDEALNYSAPDASTARRATNYWLGDIAEPENSWVPDGLVTVADITKLSGMYGDAPTGDYLACDVGPSESGSTIGVPLPDDFLGFEDLMLFSLNYGVVGPARAIPLLGGTTGGVLALSLEEVGRSGSSIEYSLVLSGNVGEVKGVSVTLALDGLEFVSARLSDAMSTPSAETFFWSRGTPSTATLDLAILGGGVTIGGSGELARFKLNETGAEHSVAFDNVLLRGVENQDLPAELESIEGGAPPAFKLVQNVPNPFNPTTTISYHIPLESNVRIRIIDVAGRAVRTLMDGTSPPGRHSAVWDGRNEQGEACGSGVYFCVMETPKYRASRKMVLMK